MIPCLRALSKASRRLWSLPAASLRGKMPSPKWTSPMTRTTTMMMPRLKAHRLNLALYHHGAALCHFSSKTKQLSVLLPHPSRCPYISATVYSLQVMKRALRQQWHRLQRAYAPLSLASLPPSAASLIYSFLTVEEVGGSLLNRTSFLSLPPDMNQSF